MLTKSQWRADYVYKILYYRHTQYGHPLVVFFILHLQGQLSQSFSNLYAFAVAVTFSFFCNARFTFRDRPTLKRYLLFTSFMGAISWLTGDVGDRLALPPLATVVVFSLISLIMGFFYSKYIVFRSKAQ